MRPHIVDLAEIAGAALIVFGLALVAMWAALVTAGVFLLAAARAAAPPHLQAREAVRR